MNKYKIKWGDILKIEVDSIFLIISECGNLIAKGTTRDRHICHIDEGDKKRFLTYSSKKRAENAFRGSGFYISNSASNYIKESYPELINKGWLFWSDIQGLFQAKEFNVSYKSV